MNTHHVTGVYFRSVQKLQLELLGFPAFPTSFRAFHIPYLPAPKSHWPMTRMSPTVASTTARGRYFFHIVR